MVECEETLQQIERFLDGEVDPAIRTTVELHLTSCHPCMDHAEFRRSLKIMISTKCAGEDVPAHLGERIRGLIRDLEGSS
jgi:mycothiol system anti-sigma-R factor